MDCRSIALLIGLTVCLIAGASGAATISFETRSLWEAQVGAFETEDFETTAEQGEICTDYVSMAGCAHEFTFSTEKLDIVIPAGSDGMHGIRDAGVYGPNGSRAFFADLHGGIPLAGVSFFSVEFRAPVSSFAVDLANVFDRNDLCTYPTPDCGPVPQPMAIVIGGEMFLLDSGSTFFGATSDTPFSSLRIQMADPSQGYLVLPVLDDISFVVVPEPATGVLWLVGWAMLATRREDRGAR